MSEGWPPAAATMMTRPADSSLAKAIIAMGKTLSLTVVAQGVENEAQAEFLREHACDELQGFLFSKPVPAAQVPALLRPTVDSPALQPDSTPAAAKRKPLVA